MPGALDVERSPPAGQRLRRSNQHAHLNHLIDIGVTDTIFHVGEIYEDDGSLARGVSVAALLRY
jgi:hypothetical protein